MTENKVQVLLQNAEFSKKLVAAESPEAIQALFAREQTEVSLEDAKQIKLLVEKLRSGELDLRNYLDDNGCVKEELSTEDLENVAGGTTPLAAATPTLVGISASLSIIFGIS